MNNSKIKINKCDECGGSFPGTQSGKHFVCANCDRQTFEVAAEEQKKAYLSGADL